MLEVAFADVCFSVYAFVLSCESINSESISTDVVRAVLHPATLCIQSSRLRLPKLRYLHRLKCATSQEEVNVEVNGKPTLLSKWKAEAKCPLCKTPYDFVTKRHSPDSEGVALEDEVVQLPAGTFADLEVRDFCRFRYVPGR